MSLIDFFKKKDGTDDYDAAAEFFVTPELIIQEGRQHDGYSLAIDTGYEDLTRTVKRIVLDGDEISINTETSYVDFQELFTAMGINEKPKTVLGKTKPQENSVGDNDSSTDKSGMLKNSVKSSAKAKVTSKIKSNSNSKSTVLNKNPIPGSMLASDMPEEITLKQKDVVESGIYYKPIKVISTLEVQENGFQKNTDIATSYYLAPISFIDGVYKDLSAAQCSHIVETSWSDAYIEAMNEGNSAPRNPVASAPVSRNASKTAIKTAFKAPMIVALSLATAFASLYGYNQYQQNNNPLSIAASNGNVGTYMSAKGANADEYTQRQLEATKAALGSMGIDVSADADIGCLIE